jgi:hypothetical protein
MTSDRCLLGCVTPCSDVVGHLPTFRRTFYLRLPREDGGNKVIRNVGILPHHYTVSHNLEDRDLNVHRRENLKYRNKLLVRQTRNEVWKLVVRCDIHRSGMRREDDLEC